MIKVFSEFRPLVLLLAPASNLGVSFEGFNVWEEFMGGVHGRRHHHALPCSSSTTSRPTCSAVGLRAGPPARAIHEIPKELRSGNPVFRASSAVLLTANSDAAFMPKKRRGGDSKIYVGLIQRTSVAVIQVASEVTDDREKQRA